jgi:hypothetical protein
LRPFARALSSSGVIRLRRILGRLEGCLVIEMATLRSLSKSHFQIFSTREMFIVLRHFALVAPFPAASRYALLLLAARRLKAVARARY